MASFRLPGRGSAPRAGAAARTADTETAPGPRRHSSPGARPRSAHWGPARGAWGGACGRPAPRASPRSPRPGRGSSASVSAGDARRAELRPEDATRAQFRRGGRASDSDGGGVGAPSCGEAAGAAGREPGPEEGERVGGAERAGVGRARPRNGRGPERGPSRSAGAVGLGPGARPRRARSPESGSSGPWPRPTRRHPHVRRRAARASLPPAGPAPAAAAARTVRAPRVRGLPSLRASRASCFLSGALARSSLLPVPSRPVPPSPRRFLVSDVCREEEAVCLRTGSLGLACGPASPRDVLILELGPFHFPSKSLKKRSRINLTSPICTEPKNLGCDWKKKKVRSCG